VGREKGFEQQRKARLSFEQQREAGLSNRKSKQPLDPANCHRKHMCVRERKQDKVFSMQQSQQASTAAELLQLMGTQNGVGSM